MPSLPGVLASSHGRVRALPYPVAMPNGGWRVREVSPTPGCWNGVKFTVLFRRHTYRVARLICEAFNGPPPFVGAVCMHSDENARNNVPGNLAWGTQRQNLKAPGFIAYCRSRTGDQSTKARAKRA